MKISTNAECYIHTEVMDVLRDRLNKTMLV